MTSLTVKLILAGNPSRRSFGYDDEIGEIGLFGDIVNAWVVFDSPDPDTLFFRVDGYSIEDVVSINFDCDGDLAFISEVDRAITFEAIYGEDDTSGLIEGFINYTPEYIDNSDDDPDLISLEFAEGEFVIDIDEDDNEFIQIEAFIDISGNKKYEGDLAPCFGNRAEGNWAIGYRYDSYDDVTPITTQQVRTSVKLRDQYVVESQKSPLSHLISWGLMSTLTFSLLIWRRKSTTLDL